MNTTGIEEARFTFVYIQNITAGDIIEQLFDKRAFLYRDNAGRLKFQLEIILELSLILLTVSFSQSIITPSYGILVFILIDLLPQATVTP